jgi:hypothetical protein
MHLFRLNAGVNFYAYCGNNPVNCSDPSGLRPLTNGEVGILSPIFNNSINYSNIDIQNGPGLNPIAAIANAQGRSITIGDTIYIAPSAYTSDFSASANTLSAASLLPHEVTHVWQNNVGDGFLATASGSIADNLTMGSAAYQYTLNPSNPSIAGPPVSFNSYGVEQQASIVQNYYILSNTNSASSVYNPAVISQYQNTLGTAGLAASSAADGGFVLYPNKSNTNQMISVYKK